jgi:8-amino-7-oxononanoate synthase
MLMLASNDYLGLAHDPRVTAASAHALQHYGTGCGASRFLAGTLRIHEELETRLAALMRKEAALVFSTGMQANLGLISALARRQDWVYADKLVHASILDGCCLSHARMARFPHNDAAALAGLLDDVDEDGGALVVIEGVYSMDGDIAPLPELIAAAHGRGARVIVDDAHGIGVLGAHGAGTAEQLGCLEDVDVIMGTFSKSLAAVGGFIAGSNQVIDYVRHHARSLIFSAALPAPMVAAVMAALEIVQQEPERRARLRQVSDALRNGLRGLGFNVGASTTPIIPVIVGSEERAVALWRVLYAHGVFTSLVIAPAVPAGSERLRLSVSAIHTDEQIARILEFFVAAGHAAQIIG